MSTQPITDKPIEIAQDGELPHEESSGVWGVVNTIFDKLGSLFNWLNTSYNYGSQTALYLSKSGGNLINGGYIEGTYRLDLNYNRIENSGTLSSSCGTMNIKAKHLTLCEGGILKANKIVFDTETILIEGGLIDASRLKVISCAEIIFRGVPENSPTFAILEHLPKGCIKTVTISSSN